MLDFDSKDEKGDIMFIKINWKYEDMHAAIDCVLLLNFIFMRNSAVSRYDLIYIRNMSHKEW